MAKVEHTSDARVLVGIDISKHRHEVLIAVPGKTRRRRLTITNGTDDFMRLIAILRDYGLPVRIGFEATGRSSRTDWFLAFLEMFPSPHMISALTKEEFTKAAWEMVGRKVEKSLMLSDSYETAKASAGLPVSPESDAIRMFRLMLAEGRSLIRQRNAIEDRAVELLAERPDYQLLRTIPGIGPINALTILAKSGRPPFGPSFG